MKTLQVPKTKEDTLERMPPQLFGNEIPDQVVDDVMAGLTGHLLLIQRSSNVNSTSNCTTYHWVVTDAEESHHLNVCWNRCQTECNQTCLDCRGAKEEKPKGLN